MDEHLLGVRINDQKAHLRKVLEEIRVANTELSKTFALVNEQKALLKSLDNEIASAHAQLADARAAALEARKLESDTLGDITDALADVVEREATAEMIVTTAEFVAETIVDSAKDEAAALSEEIQRLDGFVESAGAKANALVADIGVLERDKVELESQIKNLDNERGTKKKILDAEIEEAETKLKEILVAIDAGLRELARVRAETAATFRNLDEREREVKRAQQDVAVLQGRLRRALAGELKK